MSEGRGRGGKPRTIDREENANEFVAKIFVGGISAKTTDEILKEHFEKYGPVTEAKIILEAATSKPRGFGFVTFKHPECVATVVSIEHRIDNRSLEVRRAVTRSQAPPPKGFGHSGPNPRAGPWQGNQGPLSNQGMNNQGNQYMNNQYQPQGPLQGQGGYPMGQGMQGGVTGMMQPGMGMNMNNGPNNMSNGIADVPAGMNPANRPFKLWVGGTRGATKAQLDQCLGVHGYIADSTVMMDRKTNRSRGFGFVTFDNSNSVERCLAGDNVIDGRRLEIKRAERPVEGEMGQGGAPMGQPGQFGAPMGQPMGQFGAPMGQGGAPMGQGGAPMGQGGAPMGQGGAPMGQGGAPMGQNMGQNMGQLMGQPMGQNMGQPMGQYPLQISGQEQPNMMGYQPMGQNVGSDEKGSGGAQKFGGGGKAKRAYKPY